MKVANFIAGATLIAGTAFHAANAAPVTPPEQLEKNYVAIGGGLYLRRDAEFSTDADGEVGVSVFSRAGINAEPGYIIDSLVAYDLEGGRRVDGGSLGILHMQLIDIDCSHNTYAAYKTNRQFPQPNWRPASSLPALSPLFRYVCAKLKSASAERAVRAAAEAEAARQAQEKQRKLMEEQLKAEQERQKAEQERYKAEAEKECEEMRLAAKDKQNEIRQPLNESPVSYPAASVKWARKGRRRFAFISIQMAW